MPDILDSYISKIDTNSFSKRIIKSGGIKINDIKVSPQEYSLKKFINNNEELKIVVGKKKIGYIKLLK